MANTEQIAPKAKSTKVLGSSVLLLSVILSVFLLLAAAPRSEGQVQDHSSPSGLQMAAQAARGAAPGEGSLLRQLGRARVATHAETGELSSLSAPEDGAIGRPSEVAANAPAEAAARGYMSKYGSLFGIEDQKSDLRTEGTERAYEGEGRSVVSFRQVYNGVPVMAGELNVEVDAENNLLVANGEALPNLSLSVEPSVSVNDARETALQKVAKDYDLASTRLRSSKPQLWIYDSRLLGGPGLDAPQLVWRMDVRGNGALDELVLVDAHSGYVALNFDQTQADLSRKSFTAHDFAFMPLPGDLVCDELNPFCFNGDADAKNAHSFAEGTYDFYEKHHGRDSIDDAGMPIVSTVHGCDPHQPCPMKNAFWNGNQVVYGNGFVTDDIVGHELTHGVTQFTSGLFYYFQSGAINESFSDTWGEWIDQTNGKGNDSSGVKWLIGEDLGVPLRSMKSPTAFGHPDRMTSPLYKADSLLSDQGGVHYNSGVGNKAAFLITDGGKFNGFTIKGLGVDRAAQIYYKVQTQMLTSGSDYEDLGHALPEACTSLNGKFGITADNCKQVANAVRATEMTKQPPVAKAPEAPMCDPGQSEGDTLFFDDMEKSNSNWLARPPWNYAPDSDTHTPRYATSGWRSMHAVDQPQASDATLETNVGIAVPAAVQTFLRFNHAYQFENPSGTRWDGGVVEYHTGNNPQWKDAGPLFTNGSGYNGQIKSGTGNVLAGRNAFVGLSNGYRSSRLDLSSLAGQDVWFRFRLGADSTVGDLGWFVDDVKVYNCIS